MTNHKRPQASILFIFGGSGDLNYRKLTPALYNLFLDDYMPEQFEIAGIGRSAYTKDAYHEHLKDGNFKGGKNTSGKKAVEDMGFLCPYEITGVRKKS